jgi:undecaprenyl-diphosphatase
MWSLIDGAVAMVTVHPGLAVLIAFAAAVVEAVAVLGILIPGTPILMAVAGATAIAGLPMTPILLVSVLGAVIGDFISFWFGCRYGGHLQRMWPLRGRPGLITRAQGFFRRHGTMSVAVCRFIPILRSTVPLVAGMSGMGRKRFLVANICSAFVWAPAHILPAQFAGKTLHHLHTGDWRMAAWFGGALVLATIGAVFAHRWVKRRIAAPAA